MGNKAPSQAKIERQERRRSAVEVRNLTKKFREGTGTYLVDQNDALSIVRIYLVNCPVELSNSFCHTDSKRALKEEKKMALLLERKGFDLNDLHKTSFYRYVGIIDIPCRKRILLVCLKPH